MSDTCRYDIAQNGRYRTISLTLRVISHISAMDTADTFYSTNNITDNANTGGVGETDAYNADIY